MVSHIVVCVRRAIWSCNEHRPANGDGGSTKAQARAAVKIGAPDLSLRGAHAIAELVELCAADGLAVCAEIAKCVERGGIALDGGAGLGKADTGNEQQQNDAHVTRPGETKASDDDPILRAYPQVAQGSLPPVPLLTGRSIAEVMNGAFNLHCSSPVKSDGPGS